MWVCVETKVGPPPCESFSLVENQKNGCFYIFGGFNTMNGEFNNNLFSFDLKELFWRKFEYKSQRIPCARAGHSCVLYKENIYLFGGEIMEKKFNDMWIFDVISLKWQEILSNDNIAVWPSVFFLKKI